MRHTRIRLSSRTSRVERLRFERTMAGGAYLDLPIGEEDIGGGTLDVGFYGALRWPASERVLLTGTLGVDFVKGPSFGSPGIVCYPPPPSPFDVPPPSLCFPVPGGDGERVTSTNVGAGVVIRTSEEALHIVGELRLEPEFNYAALSGGADYALPGLGHLRGAVLVGLDDGAPDAGLVAQLVRPLLSSTESRR